MTLSHYQPGRRQGKRALQIAAILRAADEKLRLQHDALTAAGQGYVGGMHIAVLRLKIAEVLRLLGRDPTAPDSMARDAETPETGPPAK